LYLVITKTMNDFVCFQLTFFFQFLISHFFLLFVFLQDRDLFSLDCLHFSAKGNALAAAALWNNMVREHV
jgi:hypothetical protein